MVNALSADAPEPAPARGGPLSGWAWPQRQRVAGEGLGPVEANGSGELVRRLFVPAERWGWEFAPPEPLPHPDDPEPVWQEPRAYDAAVRANRKQIRELPWHAAGVGAVSACGWLAPVVGNPLVASGLLAAGSVLVLANQWGSRSRLQTARANRDFAHSRHRAAVERWRQRRQEHEYERQRQEAAEHWFPLRPDVGAARVDVFGGNGDGWASLITTVGSSLLRAGSRVMVVDLSEHHIADGLAEFADAAGFSV